MATPPDPLDTGKPSAKRWEEFRAQYSAALLTHWVFRDLAREAADAVQDLSSRMWSSLDSYPELFRKEASERGEEWDGWVPLHGRDDTQTEWFHVDDLAALEESLFPHGLRNASIEFAVRAAVVVGLHSALDTYAKQIGIDVRKGLPDAIRAHLTSMGETLSADLAEILDDFDASRHIIVHNRGQVDDKYVRRVRNPSFELGEFRSLSDSLIDSFARAVYRIARLLRKHDNSATRE